MEVIRKFVESGKSEIEWRDSNKHQGLLMRIGKGLLKSNVGSTTDTSGKRYTCCQFRLLNGLRNSLI